MSDEEVSFKHWIIRSIMTGAILFLIVGIIDYWTDFDIIIHTLLAITITLLIGFTHEGLHYYEAIKLGYEPKWYRTRLTMGFEISHHSKRDQWMIDKRKIALIPYYYLVPLSIIILVIGIYFLYYGIIVAGIAGLLLHAISFKKEGVDIKTKRLGRRLNKTKVIKTNK